MPLAESSIPLVIAAVVCMLSTLLAAIVPDADAAQAGGIVIMDDSRLRLICIAGSLGGAVVSVMLFTVTSHKELARKMTVSCISGIVFSPVIMRYVSLDPTTDYVLLCSAVTAMLSWTLLQTVIPMVTQKIVTKIGGVPPPAPPAPPPPAS